jgi:hypothetical protein
MVKNRAFQGSTNIHGIAVSTPSLDSYAVIGQATIHLDIANPLSSALQTVFRVDVPSGKPFILYSPVYSLANATLDWMTSKVIFLFFN